MAKDTVSKEVTRRRLSCQDFVLSFLKNHKAHLFCNGCFTYEGTGADAPSSVDCPSLAFSCLKKKSIRVCKLAHSIFPLRIFEFGLGTQAVSFAWCNKLLHAVMNHVPIITAKQCQKIYGKKISLDGFSFFLSKKYHAFTKKWTNLSLKGNRLCTGSVHKTATFCLLRISYCLKPTSNSHLPITDQGRTKC